MKTKQLTAFLLALCMLVSLAPAVSADPWSGASGVRADAGQEPLPYVDEFGQEQTVSDYTVLTGEETILPEGWYAVLSDVSYSDTIYLHDDVRIVLADGCTMNVGSENGGLGLGVLHNTASGSVTIYGQSAGTGTLNAWADRAILMSNSNGALNPFILNGGNVNAFGGVTGLETRVVNVNRGSLRAEGADYGIASPNVNILGGRVYAHAVEYHGINSETVSIIGGQVSALTDSDSYNAYAIRANTLTLGCTEPEDYITANRYSMSTALQIAEGQILTDGSKAYYGTIAEPYLLNGISLRSARGLVLLDESIWNGSVTVSQENPVAPGTELTLTLRPQEGFEIGAVSWFDGSQTHELQPVDGVCGFTMPDGAALVRVSFTPIRLEVPYLDADGALNTAQALPLPEGSEGPLEPDWYVVNRDMEYNDRLIFSKGDVHLILADGCTLRVNGGDWSLYLICGYYNPANLFVYGQSEGTGVMDLSGSPMGSAFAVEGNYTQNGGTVRGFDSEMCSDTVGDFVLNGGSFIGSVRRSCALFVEGSFRMTGGVFRLQDDEGNVLEAINDVSILGGQFTAIPGDEENEYGVIGENFTLGCTGLEDFICAGSISCLESVQIAEGQTLTDGETHYSGVIADPSVLDGKTLTSANVFSITLSECRNGTVVAPAKAFVGDRVVLTVTPDEGYGLCSLRVTDAAGEPVPVTDNAFTMPESSVLVTAVFGRLLDSPTAASGLVYNGSEQTGVPSGEGYTLTGTAAAKNAGSYQAEAVLEEGWLWSDGTTEAKQLSWSIARAPLCIRAENQSKPYGETEPELNAVVEGAFGDDEIRYELFREEGEHVGKYAINVTPGDNPNYEVSVVGAVFTIVKADPPCNVPDELWAVVGQTLEQVELPAGWTWDDPTQRLEEEGERIFPASFTPEDLENYNSLEHIGLRVIAVIVRFVDVPEGSFYYDPVYWAVAKGITAGTTETTFSPKQTATRAEVVTFLWRMAGSPEPETADCAFEDVPDEAYYRKAVLWATENGITAGLNAKSFGVGTVCTREQIIAFLWKMAGKPEPSLTESPFDDVKPGYSYKAILWAYENGITVGTEKNYFNRKAGCTRAQIVTFLHHCSELLNGQKLEENQNAFKGPQG